MRDVPPGWRWGDPLPGRPEPVEVYEPPPATRPAGRRAVYGRVYELITGDPQDGPHPYVGMTTQTIRRRTHGPNGHTSPASVAKDPWKARILPGPGGVRLLENVYDTGDPAENDRALRRAEAFWIDRLRPTHNEVRPVRPPAHHPRPAKRSARPTVRRARRVTFRHVALLVLIALATYLAARVTLAMELPWPAAPWVVAPAVGVTSGFLAYARIHAIGRKARLWR